MKSEVFETDCIPVLGWEGAGSNLSQTQQL